MCYSQFFLLLNSLIPHWLFVEELFHIMFYQKVITETPVRIRKRWYCFLNNLLVYGWDILGLLFLCFCLFIHLIICSKIRNIVSCFQNLQCSVYSTTNWNLISKNIWSLILPYSDNFWSGKNLAQLVQNGKNRQIKSVPNLIFFSLRQIKFAPILIIFWLRQIKSMVKKLLF